MLKEREDINKLSKFKVYYEKFMIKNPLENKKLHIFHLIVACIFYVDFIITSFLLSNYEFLKF
jgi:hypothetical protein